jgi:nitrite reductase/ring-hydroxylating ferredoxin subunit
MPDPARTTGSTDRRFVLGGIAAGAALPLVAACGSSGDSQAQGTAGGSGSGGATAGTGQHKGKGGAGGKVIATTSEIPVGGGKIFASQKLVVTQPSQGEFKCFSAVCTHQGCLVNRISGQEIDCPCHGSQFSTKDGSVLGGPAPSPLKSEPIQVKGDKIVLG